MTVRFCPFCGGNHIEERRDAFVEIGEYDENTGYYEEETGIVEYECTDCKKFFFAD